MGPSFRIRNPNDSGESQRQDERNERAEDNSADSSNELDCSTNSLQFSDEEVPAPTAMTIVPPIPPHQIIVVPRENAINVETLSNAKRRKVVRRRKVTGNTSQDHRRLNSDNRQNLSVPRKRVVINEAASTIHRYRPAIHQNKTAAEPSQGNVVLLEELYEDSIPEEQRCERVGLKLKTLEDLHLDPAITHLFCQDNQITSLPGRGFPQLYYLNINFNRLQTLRASDFHNLTILEVINNKLKELPSLPRLQLLFCAENQLEVIPNFPQLIELYAEDNQITTVGYCPRLLIARLQRNKLRRFIPGTMPSLQELWCHDNPLRSLEGHTFPALQWCNANRCKVEELNGSWTELLALFINHNRLKTLYTAHLPVIEILECNNNRLEGNFPELPTLYDLRCENNSLQALPAKAPALQVLFSRGNRFYGPPPVYPNLRIME